MSNYRIMTYKKIIAISVITLLFVIASVGAFLIPKVSYADVALPSTTTDLASDTYTISSEQTIDTNKTYSAAEGADVIFKLTPSTTSLRHFQISGTAAITVTFDGIKFTSLYDNGGIAITNSNAATNVVFNNCTFTNLKNTNGSGGAIEIASGFKGNVSIQNCIFTENVASSNGGAVFFGVSVSNMLTINNSKFYNNSAAGMGGAVAATVSISTESSREVSLSIINSIIGADSDRGNNGANGGGIAVYDNIAAKFACQIEKNKIQHNSATTLGGGIYVYRKGGSTSNNSLIVEGNEIIENSAPSGGGIYYNQVNNTAAVNGSIRINNNIFNKNAATVTGGGIHYLFSNLFKVNTSIAGNKFFENTAPDGGAVYFDIKRASGTPSIITASNIFKDNTATLNGNHIYILDAETVGSGKCLIVSNLFEDKLSNGTVSALCINTDKGDSTKLIVQYLFNTFVLPNTNYCAKVKSLGELSNIGNIYCGAGESTVLSGDNLYVDKDTTADVASVFETDSSNIKYSLNGFPIVSSDYADVFTNSFDDYALVSVLTHSYTDPNGVGTAVSHRLFGSGIDYGAFERESYNIEFKDKDDTETLGTMTNVLAFTEVAVTGAIANNIRHWAVVQSSMAKVFDAGTVYNVGANLTLYGQPDSDEAKDFTVTFYNDDGTTILSQVEANADETVEIPSIGSTVSKNTGSTYFDGWYDINDSEITDSSITVSGNTSIYAKFHLPIKVTFYDTSGIALVTALQYIADGGTIAGWTTPPNRAGYVFRGWSTTKADDGFVGDADSIVLSTDTFSKDSSIDIEFYSVWTVGIIAYPKDNSYLSKGVTYDSENEVYVFPLAIWSISYSLEANWAGFSNGASGTPTYTASGLPNGLSLSAGGTLSGTIPNSVTAGDYSFTLTASYSAVSEITPVTINCKITVIEKDEFTVNFNSQGGSAVSKITDARYNQTITSPSDPTKKGYTFGGWYKESACTNAWNFSTDKIVGDITLYAKWTPAYTIDITISDGGLGADTLVGGTYNAAYAGATILASITELPEETFTYSVVGLPVGLSINNNTGVISGTPSVAGDYNVTVTATLSDSTLSASKTVALNIEKAVPEGHYSTTEVITSKTIKITANAPISEYGYIVKGSGSVTFTPLGSTSVIIEGLQKATEYEVRLKFAETAVYKEYELTLDITTLQTYQVTFVMDDGFTQLKTETVDSGSSATAPPNPTKNSTQQYEYTFTVWDTVFSNVTSNLTVTAQFSQALRKYLVTFKSDSGENLEIIEVEWGSAVEEITAPTKTGYVFTYWYAGADDSTSYGFDTLITGELTLSPLYTAKSLSIDTDSLSNGSVTSQYSNTIIATSEEDLTDDETLKFEVAVGTLPNGLSLNSSGAISGTPTKGGSYTFTVKVSIDGTDVYVTKQYTLQIERLTANNTVYNITTQEVTSGTILITTNKSISEYGYKLATNESSINYTSSSGTTISLNSLTKNTKYIVSIKFAQTDIYEEYVLSREIRTKDIFTITFNSNGGTSVSNKTVEEGLLIEKPTAPIKNGYSLDGWYMDSGLNTEWNFASDVANASRTLYAKWTAKALTVTTDSLSNGTVNSQYSNTISATLQNKTDDETLKFEVTVGELPNGLTLSNSGTISGTPTKGGSYTFTIKVSVDGTDVYTTKEYTVEIERLTADSSVYNVTGQQVTSGVISITTNSKMSEYGYKLASDSAEIVYESLNSVSLRIDSLTADTEYVVSIKFAQTDVYKEYVLTINFETLQIFKVTFVMDDGSTQIGDVVYVDEGSSAIAPSNPTKNSTQQYEYTFTGWDTDFSNVTSNLTVTAQFSQALRKYLVTFKSDSGENLEAVEVEWGSAVEKITAPTKTGYVFTYWYAGADNATPYDFDTLITGELTLSPLYAAKEITFDNGELSGGIYGDNYEAQLNATISEKADEVFEFDLAGGSVMPEGLSLSIDGKITGTLMIAGKYSFDVIVSVKDSDLTKTATFSIDIARASISFDPQFSVEEVDSKAYIKITSDNAFNMYYISESEFDLNSLTEADWISCTDETTVYSIEVEAGKSYYIAIRNSNENYEEDNGFVSDKKDALITPDSGMSKTINQDSLTFSLNKFEIADIQVTTLNIPEDGSWVDVNANSYTINASDYTAGSYVIFIRLKIDTQIPALYENTVSFGFNIYQVTFEWMSGNVSSVLCFGDALLLMPADNQDMHYGYATDGKWYKVKNGTSADEWNFTSDNVDSDVYLYTKTSEYDIQIELNDSNIQKIFNNYSGVVTANISDMTAEKYNYSISSGALPLGLSLNSVSGAITGIPTEFGKFDFSIKATLLSPNGTALYYAVKNFVVNISKDIITFDTESNGLGGGTYDEEYLSELSVTFFATEGYLLKYAVTQGALPDGLSLGSDGKITGTADKAGKFTFTVKAYVDGYAEIFVLREFSITIAKATSDESMYFVKSTKAELASVTITANTVISKYYYGFSGSYKPEVSLEKDTLTLTGLTSGTQYEIFLIFAETDNYKEYIVKVELSTLNLYTVRFMVGESEVSKKDVAENSTVEKPTLTNNYYTVENWYIDSDFKTLYNFESKITANTVLYAKVNAIYYTVTFVTNGGNQIESVQVKAGDTVTPPIPSRDEFTFIAWYADENLSVIFNNETKITKDTVIYAKWISDRSAGGCGSSAAAAGILPFALMLLLGFAVLFVKRTKKQ